MQEGTFLLQVRVPIQTRQGLKDEAAKCDRSVNWLVNRILAEALSAAKKDSKQ